MKTQFYIFLFLLSLFTSCRSQLTQDFGACYPEEKLQKIHHATQYLDNVISEQFPSETIAQSYQLFAKKWATNPNFAYEIFDENTVTLLRRKLKGTLLLNELVYTYDTGKIGYYQCLRQLDDVRINRYLSNLADVNQNLHIAFIIDGLASEEISTYDDLHFLILRVELIINLTNLYDYT